LSVLPGKLIMDGSPTHARARWHADTCRRMQSVLQTHTDTYRHIQTHAACDMQTHTDT